ncbi:MAG TPA: PhoH family protein [bacterium]|nr:PhoH family protein [bacterium]
MKKTFVLDTNVLIHNPHSLESFEDNTVVIPLGVLEELDTFKKYEDERGRNAREVARMLDNLRAKGNLQEGIPLASGGILKVDISSPTTHLPASLAHIKIDNNIIGIALDLKEKGENVKFITKDINLRIKADALGVVSEDFETNKVNIDELYPGWAQVTVKDAQIDEFYKKGSISLKDFDERPLYENEFLVLKSDIHESKTALGIYREANKDAQALWFKEPEAWGIRHLNREQLFALNLLLNDRICMVTLVGSAGTGKTLLALATGLLKTLDEKKYRRVLVSRPIVPMGKDIGYLPGTKDEKLMNWMQPIFDNLEFILDKGHLQSDAEEVDDKVQYLLDSHKLEMEALTYIRGRSIPKQFMIVDEAQNLTPHEIKTIVSRAGVGTKIVLTGDPYQIDNPYLDASSNGMVYLAERFKGNEMFGHITLSKSERSPLAALAAKAL